MSSADKESVAAKAKDEAPAPAPDPEPDPTPELAPPDLVPDAWKRTAGLITDLHVTVDALVEKAEDEGRALDAKARKAAHDAIDAAEKAIEALEAKLAE